MVSEDDRSSAKDLIEWLIDLDTRIEDLQNYFARLDLRLKILEGQS